MKIITRLKTPLPQRGESRDEGVRDTRYERRDTSLTGVREVVKLKKACFEGIFGEKDENCCNW